MLKERFFKNSQNYEKTAQIQNIMGDELLKIYELDSENLQSVKSIFEFGCALGEFTKKLQKKFLDSEILCSDINNYFEHFQNLENINFACFDMNDFLQNIGDKKFDLVASNAVLQWLDSEFVLQNLHKILNKNGEILISSFGEKNFWQIREICAIGLQYLPLKMYEKLLFDFEILKLENRQYDLRFDSALELFKHISKSGVNAIKKEFFLSKEMLKKCEVLYKNTLTFDCVFLHARLKD